MKIKDLPKIGRQREKHKGAGHRGRLRLRFLQGGLDSFLDYEIVELLLTLGTPRRDCKDMAKEAIQSSAAQIIIAHNHPSENPVASPEDVALTRRLGEAAKIFGIELLDHIIVTKDKFYSLKEQDLI